VIYTPVSRIVRKIALIQRYILASGIARNGNIVLFLYNLTIPYHICVQHRVDYICFTRTVGVDRVCHRFEYSHFCRHFGVAVLTFRRFGHRAKDSPELADAGVMGTVLGVVDVVVVVDVAVVHGCISVKRYYHTLHSVTDMLILFFAFYLSD